MINDGKSNFLRRFLNTVVLYLKQWMVSKNTPGSTVPIKGFSKHCLGKPKYPGVFSNSALFGSVFVLNINWKWGSNYKTHYLIRLQTPNS